MQERTARLAIGIVLAASLASCSKGGGHGGGGGGGGSPTSPSSGGAGTPPGFAVDSGVRFGGSHPAPVVVNGMTYLYTNSGTDGTMVEASPDGLTFAPTPATFPAGISRSIVSLPDGRFRMYYFPDGTSVDVWSAISSDGLNWTVEAGTRYSDPNMGALRAMVLPTGGYRLHYPTSTGISSAMSIDGLTFVAEGPVGGITPPDSTFSWGPSAGAYLNGKYHLILTKTPSSGISELWHAVSTDGRNWTVDKSASAANPSVPFNQPAWSPTGGIQRIYFRAQPPGQNVIQSGTFMF